MKELILCGVALALFCLVDPSSGFNVTDVQLQDIRAEYHSDKFIYVRWLFPEGLTPPMFDGYRVYYKTIGKRSFGPEIVLNFTSCTQKPNTKPKIYYVLVPAEEKKIRYVIQIAPYKGDEEGRLTEEVSIYFSGKPVHVTPSVAVTAFPIAPGVVVFAHKTLGNENLTNVQFFYATEGQTRWTQVTEASSSEEHQYVVLKGLRKDTVYDVMAKGWVGPSYHPSFTSVRTPRNDSEVLRLDRFGEGLELLLGNNNVTWYHWDLSEEVLGFVVTAAYTFLSNGRSASQKFYMPYNKRQLGWILPSSIALDVISVEMFDHYSLVGYVDMIFRTPPPVKLVREDKL